MHIEHTSSERFVALFLVLFASVGCEKSPDVRRLGPPLLDSLEVGRQVREVLRTAPQHEFPVDSMPGCTVVAGAAVQGDKHGQARLEAKAGEEVTAEVTARSLVSGKWVDLRMSVPAPGADTIRLVAAGDPDAVVWSRPLIVCPNRWRRAKPNVILISLDTLRADRLGVYGDRRGLTTSLDAIASRATVFEHAYAHYPNTLGSHATLFTGRYPCQHRVLGGVPNKIPRTERTLAKVFQENGYVTVAFTEDAYVSSSFGFDVGFDAYDNGPSFGADAFRGDAERTFQRTLNWLRSRPRGPFFLFLHTYAVHTPYTPSQASLDFVLTGDDRGYAGAFQTSYDGLAGLAFNDRKLTLDPPALKRIERLYDAEVRDLDGVVERLFEALAGLGLDRNTLVVLFADHGEEFGEHGYLGHGKTLHGEALHVPLMFWQPGSVSAGRRVTPPVGLIDVGPTIMGLVGVEGAFAGWPERDRSSVIVGDAEVSQSVPVYSELHEGQPSCDGSHSTGLTVCPFGAVAVRTAEHTYIRSHDAHENAGADHLFDVRADPGELRDIAAERPDLTEHFAALAEEHASFCRESTISTGAAQLDSDTTEKLRALGYMN